MLDRGEPDHPPHQQPERGTNDPADALYLGQREQHNPIKRAGEAALGDRHHHAQPAHGDITQRLQLAHSLGPVIERGGQDLPSGKGGSGWVTRQKALIPRLVPTNWGELKVTQHVIDRWHQRLGQLPVLIANIQDGKRASKGQLRRCGALNGYSSVTEAFYSEYWGRDQSKMWGIVAADNSGVFVVKGTTIVTYLPFWRRYEGPRM